ncbi:MAG: hypothetical protein O3C69_00605, partial [Chloroflexi bacterium]|nr:hypothetical protein [Chloroflexota bacterium]
SFSLLPVLTTVENVELPLLLAGVTQREARQRAKESLSMAGLVIGLAPQVLASMEEQFEGLKVQVPVAEPRHHRRCGLCRLAPDHIPACQAGVDGLPRRRSQIRVALRRSGWL